MTVTGVAIYVGLWASIAENFNEFKVSQDLETAKRISGYEGVRYGKGDYRLEKVFREAQLLSQQQQQALAKALQAVNRSLMPKLILLIIVMFIGGIFISHKIAGPMYRFERSAEAVKRGDLQARFAVRKGDEMKQAASSLESMMEALRLDIGKLKTAQEKLKKEVTSTGHLPLDKVQNLNETVKAIEEVLSKYKI